jgi:hypothetical protein
MIIVCPENQTIPTNEAVVVADVKLESGEYWVIRHVQKYFWKV